MNDNIIKQIETIIKNENISIEKFIIKHQTLNDSAIKEIKSIYRKTIMKYHPDRQNRMKESSKDIELVKKLNIAMENIEKNKGIKLKAYNNKNFENILHQELIKSKSSEIFEAYRMVWRKIFNLVNEDNDEEQIINGLDKVILKTIQHKYGLIAAMKAFEEEANIFLINGVFDKTIEANITTLLKINSSILNNKESVISRNGLSPSIDTK